VTSEPGALPRAAETVSDGLSPGTRRRVWPSWAAVAHVVSAASGPVLFVFALQVVKAGAAAIVPVLETLDVAGPSNALGFGWLSAYLALSGSPVAAIAITLMAGGVLSESETFAVIGGSRLGASFIVLAVGYALYLAGRRNPDGLAIGVIALLTTFTTQGPAIVLGLVSLHYGWLDHARFTPPPGMLDWIDAAFGPPVDFLSRALPDGLVFVAGLTLLLASFALFDRALPRLEAGSTGLERVSRRLDSRWPMFVLGATVTLMTLSVSVSLTLLVPLSLKGYLRRDQVVPYVMGANITTFVDTLAGAVVLGGAGAFTVVLTEMAAVTLVSAAILLVAYGWYSRAILGLAGAATQSQGRLGLFLGTIVAVPLLLVLL